MKIWKKVKEIHAEYREWRKFESEVIQIAMEAFGWKAVIVALTPYFIFIIGLFFVLLL